MYDLLSDTEKEDALISIFMEFLGTVRNHYSNKKQIAFDCPQCSYDKGVTYDGKGNLEINYGKGKFNCWACGEDMGTHGRVYNLVKKWGTEKHLNNFKGLKFKFNSNDEDQLFEFKPIEELKLPAEYTSLVNAPDLGLNRPFFTYLYNRGITPEIIEKFNIGCAFSGKYKDRIILPSYNAEGELNYWVTRSIHKWVRKFKYMNCSIPKQTIIFNEKLIDWEKTIFIVEGPFDHIVLPNSIPLLGKQMGDLLFSEIYSKVEAGVVIILDPDAAKRNEQIYNKLDGGRLMNKISTVTMPTIEKKEIDISKFVELYGQQELFKYIQRNVKKFLM